MKKAMLKTAILFLFTVIVFTACSTDDNGDIDNTPTKSNEAVLKSLKLTKADNSVLYTDVETQVNEDTKKITATINAIVEHEELDNDISVIPQIVISDKATVDAQNITLKNDGTPTSIVVTAEDGTTETYTFKPNVRFINKVATEVVKTDELIALYVIEKTNPDSALDWNLNAASADDIKKSLQNNGIKLSNDTKQIISLNLSDKNLVNLPDEIGNLTELTYLNIDGNALPSVPVEIGNLVNLTELFLGGGNITSLPAEIGNLTKLSLFDLTNNDLENLPIEIGNLTKLVGLGLEGNNLTGLPSGIGNLLEIKELYLSYNKLTSIPVEIENLTKLTDLSIDNNDLTSLPESIVNLTNLTTFYLADNKISSLTQTQCTFIKNVTTHSLDNGLCN